MASKSTGTNVFDGDVVIRGNVRVEGQVVADGQVVGSVLRTTAGMVRFGGDDGKDSQDQTLFLQRNCGSRNQQSALVQKPVGPTNGALFLQIPGDQIQGGSIACQILQYGPIHEGNPRRQRLSPGTVYVQLDGNPFGTISTTMSGTGDGQGMAPMPVLFNNNDVIMARLDGNGFVVAKKPEPADPVKPTPADPGKAAVGS